MHNLFKIQQTINSELSADAILMLLEKHLKEPMGYSFMTISEGCDRQNGTDVKLCLKINSLQLHILMPVYSCTIIETGKITQIVVQPAHFRKVFTLFTTAAVIFTYLLFTTETYSPRDFPASLLLTLAGFGSASIIALLSYRFCTGKVTSILQRVVLLQNENRHE